MAPADDDVVALVDLREERADVGRIVLQVAVHRHEHLAARLLDAGRHGRRLAVVAAELHDAHARVAARDLGGELERAVPAAVVHEDHLERNAERLERAHDGGVHARHVVLFVVEGDDDG